MNTHQSSKLRFNGVGGPMIDVEISTILPPKYNNNYKGYQIPIVFNKGYTNVDNKYMTFLYTKVYTKEEALDKYYDMLKASVVEVEVVNSMMPHLNKHPEAIKEFKWNSYRRGYNVRKRRHG